MSNPTPNARDAQVAGMIANWHLMPHHSLSDPITIVALYRHEVERPLRQDLELAGEHHEKLRLETWELGKKIETLLKIMDLAEHSLKYRGKADSIEFTTQSAADDVNRVQNEVLDAISKVRKD